MRRLEKPLRQAHTEDMIQLLFVSTSVRILRQRIICYQSLLVPAGADTIRWPWWSDFTHIITRYYFISNVILAVSKTSLTRLRQSTAEMGSATSKLRASFSFRPSDIDLLSIARSQQDVITKRGDTVDAVWKRIWYRVKECLLSASLSRIN